MVPVRVELTTLTLLASRSNQLSYGTLQYFRDFVTNKKSDNEV